MKNGHSTFALLDDAQMLTVLGKYLMLLFLRSDWLAVQFKVLISTAAESVFKEL